MRARKIINPMYRFQENKHANRYDSIDKKIIGIKNASIGGFPQEMYKIPRTVKK